MSHKGLSHIGLSTLDLDKTRDFYENVMGFKPGAATSSRSKKAARSGTSSLTPDVINSLPLWKHAGYRGYRQNMMRGSIAGSGYPARFITLPLRLAR